jgi:hypothetical protein
MRLAWSAKRSVLSVSAAFTAAGDTVATRHVLALPPSESWSR